MYHRLRVLHTSVLDHNLAEQLGKVGLRCAIEHARTVQSTGLCRHLTPGIIGKAPHALRRWSCDAAWQKGRLRHDVACIPGSSGACACSMSSSADSFPYRGAASQNRVRHGS